MKRFHLIVLALGFSVLLAACGLGGSSATLKNTTTALKQSETIWQAKQGWQATVDAKNEWSKLAEDPQATRQQVFISADGALYGGGEWQLQKPEDLAKTLKAQDREAFSLEQINDALKQAGYKDGVKETTDLVAFKNGKVAPIGVLIDDSNLYAVTLAGKKNDKASVTVFVKGKASQPSRQLSSETLYGTWQSSGQADILVTDEQLYEMDKNTVHRTAIESLASIPAQKLYANTTFSKHLATTLMAGVAMPRSETLAAAGNGKVYVFLDEKTLAVIDQSGKRSNYQKTSDVIAINAWPTGLKKAFTELDAQVKDTHAISVSPNGTKTFIAEMTPSLNGLTNPNATKVTGKKEVLIWNAGEYDTQTRARITDIKK